MLNDSYADRRCTVLFSRECLAELLNLPQGAIITNVQWEDKRRIFIMSIENIPFGSKPDDGAPVEFDGVTVVHTPHHIVHWPAPAATVNSPIVQLRDHQNTDPSNNNQAPSLSGFNLGAVLEMQLPTNTDEESNE